VRHQELDFVVGKNGRPVTQPLPTKHLLRRNLMAMILRPAKAREANHRSEAGRPLRLGAGLGGPGNGRLRHDVRLALLGGKPGKILKIPLDSVEFKAE
jgi:hypothetical protein